MVCRKCAAAIVEKEGEHPVMGYSFQIDKNGEKIPESEQTFGFFHADCWAELQASLGPADPA